MTTEYELKPESVVLVIEGTIGVGKSTAIKSLLAEVTNLSDFDEVVVVPEPIKKPVLDDYIADMKAGNKKLRAWSFQMNTAVKRLHDYERSKRLALEKRGRLVVIDRGLYGNEAFARMQCKRGHFDQTDLRLYETEIGVYDGTLDAIRDDPIFQTVYLHCTPNTSWKRTLTRGDAAEVDGYNEQYMEDLYEAHEAVLASAIAAKRNVTVLDWENDAEVADGMINAELVKKILKAIHQQ
jgi:deoxyadenosine/deoxycytidine kinase